MMINLSKTIDKWRHMQMFPYRAQGLTEWFEEYGLRSGEVVLEADGGPTPY